MIGVLGMLTGVSVGLYGKITGQPKYVESGIDTAGRSLLILGALIIIYALLQGK